jgi:hypothetical protein
MEHASTTKAKESHDPSNPGRAFFFWGGSHLEPLLVMNISANSSEDAALGSFLGALVGDAAGSLLPFLHFLFLRSI